MSAASCADCADPKRFCILHNKRPEPVDEETEIRARYFESAWSIDTLIRSTGRSRREIYRVLGLLEMYETGHPVAKRRLARTDVITGDLVFMPSYFRGKCRVCAAYYERHAQIAWRKGAGAVHARCVNKWEAAA